jgi:hypothetical protein
MVQATFDDRLGNSHGNFSYQDTGRWDANRNTDEFIAALPIYRSKGLDAFTINLQGGAPGGGGGQLTRYWHNSAINNDGSLDPEYMKRAAKVIDRADELGMVVILGIFYSPMDRFLEGESAVLEAVYNVMRWLIEQEFTNVMVEINNECNLLKDHHKYVHAPLFPNEVHKLIRMAQSMVADGGRAFPVSTSFTGGFIPSDNVVQAADYILFHGNGVREPQRIAEIAEAIRRKEVYRGQPIVINEDDQHGYDQATNNMTTAVESGVSWGYFDWIGFQKVPANWGIDTERKKQFFDLLYEMTGGAPT